MPIFRFIIIPFHCKILTPCPRVGFRDRRGSGAVILRPLRELSSKEVSLYCVYNKLATWHGQEVQGVGDTIRNVTQEFLVGLQVRRS